jgi:hypothetical protein
VEGIGFKAEGGGFKAEGGGLKVKVHGARRLIDAGCWKWKA